MVASATESPACKATAIPERSRKRQEWKRSQEHYPAAESQRLEQSQTQIEQIFPLAALWWKKRDLLPALALSIEIWFAVPKNCSILLEFAIAPQNRTASNHRLESSATCHTSGN